MRAASAVTHFSPPPSIPSQAGEVGIPGSLGLAPPGTEGGSGAGVGGVGGHRKEGLCFVLSDWGGGKVPAGASWAPGPP